MFARPTYYLAALGLPADFDKVTAQDVKKAYAAMAGNGEHPDHGGNGERWSLVTAAYNELKGIYSKKRGRYESKSDERWYSAWVDLTRPQSTTPPTEPKADAPKAGKQRQTRTDGWVFEEREGESKDDRRKRYARERQAFRYANDPDFATARKASSKKSHASKTAK